MLRIVTMLLFMALALTVNAQRCEHKVQRGEDFESIAQKYSITVEELMEANPSSKACYVGRVLLIPYHGVPVEQKDPEVAPFDYGLTSSDDKVLTKSAATAYQVGQALLKAGKTDEAQAYLKVAADSGEVRSYFAMGEHALKNNNHKQAVEYFSKAAAGVKDKNDEAYWHSCGYLAEAFLNGTGVDKNLNEAERYALEYASYALGESKDHSNNILQVIYNEKEAIARAERERQAELRRQQQAEQKSQVQQKQHPVAQKGSSDLPFDINDCIRLAEQGDAYAQYDLGLCYYEGEGVTQSYAEAVKWYRKAAEQGVAYAQNNLGMCYVEGKGVTQSYAEAVKWFRKAAEQGYADAQYNLAIRYSRGQGVTQSYTEAVKWYRKAAEQGVAEAQCNLGLCYDEGKGVTQSYTEAVKWYRKAAEQGVAEAQNNLAFCYDKGEGVTQSYTEAVKWYTKAAEQGLANAQYNLAICYFRGRGVTQSYTEAEKWCRKAAEQGDEGAKRLLTELRVLSAHEKYGNGK